MIPTETERIETWRLQVLMDAGYPFDLADQIARADTDLHRAVELLQRGCTPQLASRILL